MNKVQLVIAAIVAAFSCSRISARHRLTRSQAKSSTSAVFRRKTKSR